MSLFVQAQQLNNRSLPKTNSSELNNLILSLNSNNKTNSNLNYQQIESTRFLLKKLNNAASSSATKHASHQTMLRAQESKAKKAQNILMKINAISSNKKKELNAAIRQKNSIVKNVNRFKAETEQIESKRVVVTKQKNVISAAITKGKKDLNNLRAKRNSAVQAYKYFKNTHKSELKRLSFMKTN
jgi:hypothetical protein